MASAMETEAAVDRRLNMSLDDLIKTSSDSRSKGRGGAGGKRGNQGKGAEVRNTTNISKSGTGKRGRGRGGNAAAGRSEIIVMEMGAATQRGGHGGKNSARNVMAVKQVGFKGRSAKSIQAVKISTKRDGTMVHKVLKHRGGRIANRKSLGNSIPLALLENGIQAPKLAGYIPLARQANARRNNSQRPQKAAANRGGGAVRGGGVIRAVPLQLGREAPMIQSRNGRGSGGRPRPPAMAPDSREAEPREVPNVRVTFQNTRPLNGSGPVSRGVRRGGGVLFPGGGW